MKVYAPDHRVSTIASEHGAGDRKNAQIEQIRQEAGKRD